MPPKMGEVSPPPRREEQQASAPQTSVNPEVPSQEDARWDIDKAETVGRVVYEQAEQDRQYGGNPFDMFPLHLPSVDPLDYRDAEEWHKVKKERERRQKEAEAANKQIAELQQHFERLYDLDPQRFSQMPVPKFMSLAQEFSQLEWRLSEAQKMVSDMKELSSLLEKSLEQKRRFDGDFWRHLIDTVKYNKDFPERESVLSTDKEVYVIARDFDNSPRQIIEKYRQIVERFIPIAETYVEQKRKERQAFFEKYGISDSAQEAPSA